MPSARTATHRPRPTNRGERSAAPRRAAFGSALLALILVVLAGCAEGTSRDAEQGRQTDAERTSVVDDLQASASADLIRRAGGGTPPPATEAPQPSSGGEGN